jgi:hypothetical protein
MVLPLFSRLVCPWRWLLGAIAISVVAGVVCVLSGGARVMSPAECASVFGGQSEFISGECLTPTGQWLCNHPNQLCGSGDAYCAENKDAVLHQYCYDYRDYKNPLRCSSNSESTKNCNDASIQFAECYIAAECQCEEVDLPGGGKGFQCVKPYLSEDPTKIQKCQEKSAQTT